MIHLKWIVIKKKAICYAPYKHLRYPKIGEVVLSALPARLRIEDTQAYIRMDCERGNPVSAQGVGGNGLWKTIIVAHTLKWPSSLVCQGRVIVGRAMVGRRKS